MNSEEIAKRELRFIGSRLYQTLDEIPSIEPPGQGIQTGWPEIEKRILALHSNRLNEVVGYTSHGKTSGMLSIMLNNLDSGKLMVIASGDDSPEALLWKLLAMHLDLKPDDVMAQSNSWIKGQAREHFQGRIAVVTPQDGNPFDAHKLGCTIDNIQQCEGAAIDLLCFDYLGSMKEAAGGQSIPTAAEQFKQVVRTFPETTFILGHQCNRDAVKASSSGLETYHVEYGGVKEVDGVMLGFRRYRNDDLSPEMREHEERVPTVFVSVMKNKVTGKLTGVEGLKMAIDSVSGRIRPLRQSELHHNITNLAEVRQLQFNNSVKDRFQ